MFGLLAAGMKFIIDEEGVGHVDIVLLANGSLFECVGSFVRCEFVVEVGLYVTEAYILLRLWRLLLVVIIVLNLIHLSLHSDGIK